MKAPHEVVLPVAHTLAVHSVGYVRSTDLLFEAETGLVRIRPCCGLQGVATAPPVIFSQGGQVDAFLFEKCG